LFLDRQTAPTEAEQGAAYAAIAVALGSRPLTIRTLDAGGDKPIAYLPLPPEENPALGLRGVRTGLAYPQLLRTQLRAVLGLRERARCRLLLPMITDVEDLHAVRAILDDVRRELGTPAGIEVGVMIETPASALLAESLAREADFLSIGTNDLTQYTLAMDRGHPQLASRLDALHPAVLRLIARTAQAAHAQGRHTAVCGGLASEPRAAPLLIGLGVNELSAVPAVIPQLKARIGSLAMAEWRALARQALARETAARGAARGRARRSSARPRPRCARCWRGRCRRRGWFHDEGGAAGAAEGGRSPHAADRGTAHRGPAAASRTAGPAQFRLDGGRGAGDFLEPRAAV